MLSKVYNYLFPKRIIDEEEWINTKLNEWKIEIFTQNKYLHYILQIIFQMIF